MSFITFEKLWNDSYLGKISSKYFEFFAQFLLRDEISTKKFFEYYKKWEFEVDEKDVKYFFSSEHNIKYLFPFFASFGELWFAFFDFEDIFFYIQNYPDSPEYRKRITLFEWGNYHLKTVNQQFFILRERALNFVKTIEKIAVAEQDSRFLKLKEIRKKILDYFEPILMRRHELVHQEAYLDDSLQRILSMGTRLEKRLHKEGVTWKLRTGSDVDEKIKRELERKAAETSEELEKLVNFLNSNFRVVWEIIKDW